MCGIGPPAAAGRAGRSQAAAAIAASPVAGGSAMCWPNGGIAGALLRPVRHGSAQRGEPAHSVTEVRVAAASGQRRNVAGWTTPAPRRAVASVAATVSGLARVVAVAAWIGSIQVGPGRPVPEPRLSWRQLACSGGAGGGGRNAARARGGYRGNRCHVNADRFVATPRTFVIDFARSRRLSSSSAAIGSGRTRRCARGIVAGALVAVG